MKNESKSELIHIRIEPEIKHKSEQIFKRLGVVLLFAITPNNKLTGNQMFPNEVKL